MDAAAGGRLGEEADALLRSWARLAAGDDLKCEKISDQASSILRQYREVVGAVLQRNNASNAMVLRAVGESGIQTLSLTQSDASGGGHLGVRIPDRGRRPRSVAYST